MRPSLWTVLVASLLIGADAPPATAVKDEAAVLGTWTTVAIEVNGQTVPETEFKSFKWVFTADELKWTDERGNTFLYKLDASKKPKQIDLTFPENKTETTEGIYVLEGDSLKVCIGKKDRPTDLTAKAGSRRYLYTMTRDKK
jgi:uncharacterized protein (TIGR03067 family)